MDSVCVRRLNVTNHSCTCDYWQGGWKLRCSRASIHPPQRWASLSLQFKQLYFCSGDFHSWPSSKALNRPWAQNLKQLTDDWTRTGNTIVSTSLRAIEVHFFFVVSLNVWDFKRWKWFVLEKDFKNPQMIWHLESDCWKSSQWATVLQHITDAELWLWLFVLENLINLMFFFFSNN